MGRCEPSHFFSQIWRQDKSVSKRKFKEFINIAQRPSLSEEVFGQLYKKFKMAHREDELEGCLETQYDPIGPWTEVQIFEEQVKINKFKETVKKEKLALIMQQ
eukprot:2042832-Heterocapsa_arctica.AAC.1